MERRKLIYAPHLSWEKIEIADYLEKEFDFEDAGISIVVENNATASAMYEVRLKFGRDREKRLYGRAFRERESVSDSFLTAKFIAARDAARNRR